ncbi:hypothetical protein DFH28DRAFT_911486, partial [Melampsora americana]
MSSSIQNKPIAPIKLADKLIEACVQLNKLGLNAKKFVQGMLTLTDSAVADRRGSWGTEYGWVSTHEVLKGFKDIICKDHVSGKEQWASFILEEAKEIVIREDLPSGEPPFGMHYNSQNITHEFFSQENEELRANQWRKICHSYTRLFQQNLNMRHSSDKKKRDASDSKKGTEKHVTASEEFIELEDFEPATAMSQTIRQLEQHRIKKVCMTTCLNEVSVVDNEFCLSKVPVMLCSMLAFCCNCRHSGLQLQNAMTFLACGVTQKVNNYLLFLGLTSSRATALDAMETL